MKFYCYIVSGSYHELQGIWFPTRIDEWASREAATHLQNYAVWDVDGKMMYTSARKHGTNNYFLESGNMKVLNLDAVIAETLNTEGKILGVSDRKIVAGQLGSNSINNRRRRASAGRLAMISLQPNALRQFCCILKIIFSNIE